VERQYFISDLHLHPSRPATLACFRDFLADIGGQARALYILGDLFESWVGDDHPEPAYRAVRLALRDCAARGTRVHLMHGNRDFLLGETFAQQAGASLLPDPALIDLYGTTTLLMHGDSLCTDDADYQQLRRRLRDPGWQRQALALPLAERLEMAAEARELSVLTSQDKEAYIMDVNRDSVLQSLRAHQADLLIHGHTHRPGVHDYELDGKTVKRVVLGDWYRQGSVLCVDCNGLQLTTRSF
jgi:UDP-2,3-diacylglucosamine hydrolase